MFCYRANRTIYANLPILSDGKATTSPVSITVGVQGTFLISTGIATTSLILAIFILWYHVTHDN